MSRRRMLVMVVVVVVLVIVVSSRFGGALERWLIELHGGGGGTAHAAEVKRDPGQAARARALEEGWPDTPAGMVAFAWVEAFAGDDDAIQMFYEKHLSKEALAKRPMRERLQSTRALRERIGTLALASIEKSAPAELTAALLAEDAAQHRFVFKVQPKAPHHLISVSTFDSRHGHGHGGGGH